jgi:hypothetical protein
MILLCFDGICDIIIITDDMSVKAYMTCYMLYWTKLIQSGGNDEYCRNT